MSFESLGVAPSLCRVLAANGIAAPFPVQAATIPDALAGLDVCGRAPTGSGKTLAFGIPIAARAAKAAPRRPRALVLVPTRELAAQVQKALAPLLPRSAGPVAAVYGGAGYGPQLEALRRASVVVACPGRLEDLLQRGDVALDEVELVVVDEADRMADMGFLPAVRRILDRTPPTRQTLLFSATLDGDVDTLITRYQRDPRRHDLVGPETHERRVEHRFWRLDPAGRLDTVADLARSHDSTIVFCRTCHGADRLARRLDAAGVDAVVLHGKRTQNQRDKAIAAFRAGTVRVLVATDVAARGIHVDDVACVVHHDLPDDPKDFVHRSGRTGRAGATGLVVTLVPPGNDRRVRELAEAAGVEPALTAPGAVAPAGPDTASVPVAVVATVATPVVEADAAPTGPANRAPSARDEGRRRGRTPDRERRPVDRDRPVDRERPFSQRPASARRPRADRSVGRERDARGERDEIRGVVASFNPASGYGFIARRGGPDVYVRAVHVQATRPLRAGQHVRFEIGPGRKGPEARNVRSAIGR